MKRLLVYQYGPNEDKQEIGRTDQLGELLDLGKRSNIVPGHAPGTAAPLFTLGLSRPPEVRWLDC